MPSLYDLSRQALGELLDDQPRYRVDQVWQGLYAAGADLDELTDVPKAVRARLAEGAPAALAPLAESVSDDGETVKWLWGIADRTDRTDPDGRSTGDASGDLAIETVLMHYDDRIDGLRQHAGRLRDGLRLLRHRAGRLRPPPVDRRDRRAGRPGPSARRARHPPRRVSNIVFMGMGEPLANYDRMWAAVERLHGDMGISARHLTVSTVGIVPGIRRLAREALPVNLAVSLHAANDELRDRLVPDQRALPAGRRWPRRAPTT